MGKLRKVKYWEVECGVVGDRWGLRFDMGFVGSCEIWIRGCDMVMWDCGFLVVLGVGGVVGMLFIYGFNEVRE